MMTIDEISHYWNTHLKDIPCSRIFDYLDWAVKSGEITPGERKGIEFCYSEELLHAYCVSMDYDLIELDNTEEED